jgi:hypothetical protein
MLIVSKRALVRKLCEHRGLTLITGGFVAILTLMAFGHLRSFAADQTQIRSKPMSTTNSDDRAATMDTATKSNAFREVLKQMGAGQKPAPALWSTFVAAQNDGLRTGPRIGQKVPDFTLPDQNGGQRSLHELMGPKGLLLIFSRSADW